MSNFVYQGVRLTYPHYMPNLDPLAKQEVVNAIVQKRKLDRGRVVSLLLLDDILSKVDDIFSISDDIFAKLADISRKVADIRFSGGVKSSITLDLEIQ